MKGATLLAVIVAIGGAAAMMERPNEIGFTVTPKTGVFVTWPADGETGLAAASTEAVARAYLGGKYAGVELMTTSAYETKHNGVGHAYFKQVINGMPVFNGWANVNVQAGRVLSYGSYITTATTEVTKPVQSPVDALKSVATLLGLSISADVGLIDTTVLRSGVSHDDVVATLGYLQTEDGAALDLVWQFAVRTDDDWYDAAVSATSGTVLSMVNWVNHATYNVYAPPVNDPEDGSRSVVLDADYDHHTSPLGWHAFGSENFTVTIGNNVYAQENIDGSSSWENNYRPDGGADLDFDFPLDLSEQPSTYVDASVTNLFYLNNVIHDVFYNYGFDEASGNFQEDNLGRGGNGGDAVQANAQDGAGYNNANFATPVDGQRPRMRMYLWNGFNPMRDGDFENSIIVHEYGHGISNRLVGGPMDVSCLPSGMAGGMGEGWSDFWGIMFMQKSAHTRTTVYPMGDYVYPGGIRHFPYAADGVDGTNPQTLEYTNNSNCRTSVHCIGSVWAQMLWDVLWNIVDKHGFSEDLYEGTAGNNQILLDVVDGLKLSQCRPDLCTMRDSILQADQINGHGNECEIWHGFAGRGMGVNAVCNLGSSVNDFTVPAHC